MEHVVSGDSLDLILVLPVHVCANVRLPNGRYEALVVELAAQPALRVNAVEPGGGRGEDVLQLLVVGVVHGLHCTMPI